MDAPDTLYLQIAQTLAASIRGGVLARGERLPSLRDLAAQHGVSLSTAVQAYRALEDMRLVETRPRSGFFVAARPPKPPVPETTQPPADSQVVDIDAQAAHAMRYAHEEGYITFGAAAPNVM
jgi:DNA-binding GntR family transcriptional regulator